ncbi:hypothetical protein CEY00_Acc07183 [Actinidia chinensis var. chinensis]|uniref:Uncharacterized protein n=1 Tax=Actinidia chinensis var. chinensis TaxID=1590841 RepID=A0A2R6QI01_ACTCC|nr:hypothetical protein CEY00_Acc07183 [Actinidia chinensis var. chinensis]
MADGSFTPNTMLETLSDNNMAFNLMDELLYDGYWLETTEGPNFWQYGPSTSDTLNFSSYSGPTSEPNTVHLNPNPHQKSHQERAEILDLGNNLPLFYPQMDELVGSQTQNREVILADASSFQPENFLVESTETNRRLWIPPSEDPSRSYSVKKRLMQAIEHLRQSTSDRDVLIQIWVPIKRGGKQFLTTNNQPFSVNSNCKKLADYRNVSMSYQFAAEENSKDFVGLPGRVFLKRLPEWTPDVQFFRREEYPRVRHAQQLDVRGSLALPVFERGSGTCLGVVEIVTTSQQANYGPELESVCKALEAVDLRSSDISSPPTLKACDDSYQAALTEIQEVLKSVCDTHGLPLAQTWAPCIQHGKAGCRHSSENYASCVSTVDSARYVRNRQVLDFHEACSEHHLLRGEGVAGGAFMTNRPCFSNDITALSKIEYPLSHHARMFGLRAAVAIRLRSIYAQSADFVLEFFLTSDFQNAEGHIPVLSSLSSAIHQVCLSLRLVTDQELAEETAFQEKVIVAPSDGSLDEDCAQKLGSSLSKESSQKESSWIADMMEAQRKGKAISVSSGYQKEEPKEESKETWDIDGTNLYHGNAFSDHKQIYQDSGPKGNTESGGDFSSVSRHSLPGVRKAGERRRTKSEKSISLQVLRQYFSGSLKDAAKSLGVCPTTLKRICRQHGITRWPSRKIKKVGHSLKKLQLIIDSVQGVDGSFQLSSFYSNFPDLSSPNLPGTSPVSTSNINDQLKQFNTKPESSLLSPVTTTSKSPSSSCSHSSSSSFYCSTETKQPPATVHALGGGDSSLEEQPGGMLKRAHSDAELYDAGQEETKLLVRSQSHKLFSELPSSDALPPPPKVGGQVSRDGSGFRVKATFGEEKIRLSIQQNWGFGDLQQEIVKRFNIDENSKINLKYLDDDSEWVLLTCDADLEECIDIHRLSRIRTVKLSVYQAFNPNLGSSFGSSGPS